MPSASDKPVHAPSAAEQDALPPGARFGELEIVRILGIGGFGIVYLARDHSLEREVALKEYMPASLATRGESAQITVRSGAYAETYAVGLRSFINEARLLAKFDHPSLVKVYRFWEANGTAYMVMPYLEGRTLRDARKAMSQSPDEAWLRSVLDPTLGALEVLHREGVYHRDIAPDNILLQDEGPPILLDFGAARRVISDRTQSLTAILKPSYAPIEQYAEMSALRQGPWTDLYALGAVVHFLLQGSPPVPATARALQDEMVPLWMRHFPGVSPRFLASIDWALAVRPKERPQSVEELRAALDGRIEPPAMERHDTVASSSVPAPQASEPTAFEPTRRMNGPGVSTTFEPTLRVAPPPPPTRTQAAPASPTRTQATAAAGTTMATTAAAAAAPAATPVTAVGRTVAAAAPAPVTATAPRTGVHVAAPTPTATPASSRLGLVLAVIAIVLGLAGGAAVRHFGLLGGAGPPAAGPAPVAEAPPPASLTPAPANETAAATPAAETLTTPQATAPTLAEPAPEAALEPAKAPAAREPRAPAARETPIRAAVEPAAPQPIEAKPVERTAAVPAPVTPRAAAEAAPDPAAPPAATAEPPTARAACGSRMLIALAYCMQRECKKPQYGQQPDCAKYQEQRRAQELR